MACSQKAAAPAAPNLAPIASISVLLQGDVASPVAISTQGTTDLDGFIASWEVDWGDLTTPDGDAGVPPDSVSHTYAIAGTYTVTLTVVDNNFVGQAASAQVVVTAVVTPTPTLPPPPVPVLNYSSGQYAGSVYVLDTTGTAASVTTSLASWSLNWGDLTTPSSGLGAPTQFPAHTYAVAGTYVATLTVTDALGQVGTIARQVIIAAVPTPPTPPSNIPPVANLTITSALYVVDPVVVSTVGTYDPDAATLQSGSINWGDGTPLTQWTGNPAVSYTHTYATAGSKVITLTVTDVSGAPNTATKTVTLITIPAPPPTTPGSYPYWEGLTQLPEYVYGRSLRTQAELNALVASPPAGKTFVDAIGNTVRQGFAYNASRDAAELICQVANAGLGDAQTSISIPTTQQLRFKLGSLFTSGSMLVTWDWMWDPNVRTNYGGTTAWKTWKFQITGDKPWWTLLDNFGSAVGTGDPAVVATLQDEGGAGMGAEPDPLTSNGVNFPLSPAGTIHIEGLNPAGASAPSQRPFGAPNGVRIYHSILQRYWVYIEMPMAASNFTDWNSAYGVTVQANPADPTLAGRWYRISKWVGDSTHGIRRVVFRWPCGGNQQAWSVGVSRYDWEMNTSKRNPLGPISGIGRNVAMLKNYTLPAVPETDTTIFDLTGV